MPQQRDSTWATEKALQALRDRYPKDEFPDIDYMVKGYERRGEDHVVLVDLMVPSSTGKGLVESMGGNGWVVIRPDGTTQIVLYQ